MKHLKKLFLGIMSLGLLFPVLAQAATQSEARGLYNEGIHFYENKEYVKAKESWEKSLTIFLEIRDELESFDTEIKRIYKNLFLIGHALKDYQFSAKNGEEYFKLEPSDEDHVKDLTNVYEKGLKDYSKAVVVWEKYNTLYDSYTAKMAIADIYANAKNIPQALEWYNKCLLVNKGDAGILEKVAKLYAENNEPRKALAVWEDFISTNPPKRDLAIAYKRMGKLYEELKDLNKQIEYNEKSVALEYDKGITLWLIQKNYEKKLINKATEHINTVLAKGNDNTALFYKGMILYDQQKFTEAKTELQKVVNDKQVGDSARTLIGRIDSAN